MNKNKDYLITEKPSRALFAFALPMIIGNLFQQAYTIVDSAIVGHYVGETALAAVGASYALTSIFICVAIGGGIGASVIISQHFGGHAYIRMKNSIRTAMLSFLLISLLLGGIGLCFSRQIMEALNTPADAMDIAVIYLNIYFYGLPFLFMYNILSSMFNALGESRIPLYLLIFSSVLNIFLDLYMVATLHLGVAGAAYATFIAQGIACVLALITMVGRLKLIKTEKRAAYFSADMLKRIARIAVPSILQQSFVSIGNIFVQGLINSFGSSVIAGYSAAIKLNTFTITSFTTLGNGISSFTAQNIGAGKVDRVKAGMRGGVKMGLLLAVPFIVAFFGFGRAMMSLFMQEESAVAMATGIQFLRIVSPFYVVIALKLASDGMLRGAGAMKEFMLATFSDLILRVVLSFVFASFLGVTGVWLSWPFGWIVGSILSLWCNRNVTKRLEKTFA